MFFPVWSVPTLPLPVAPSWGFGFNGFGGFNRSHGFSGYASWMPPEPSIRDFGPYAGPASRPVMPSARSCWDGPILDQVLALDASTIGGLGEWLTALGRAKGQGASDAMTPPQPPVKFVESPDMFRSKSESESESESQPQPQPEWQPGRCPPPTPVQVDEHTMDFASVGPGGVTSNIGPGLVAPADFHRTPL